MQRGGDGFSLFFSYKKSPFKSNKSTVHLRLSMSSRLNRGRTETYTVFSSAMYSSENTYTSAVLVLVILVFSLLNDPVIGKPLLASQEEEWSNFPFTYRDKMHLMEKYDVFNC